MRSWSRRSKMRMTTKLTGTPQWLKPTHLLQRPSPRWVRARVRVRVSFRVRVAPWFNATQAFISAIPHHSFSLTSTIPTAMHPLSSRRPMKNTRKSQTWCTTLQVRTYLCSNLLLASADLSSITHTQQTNTRYTHSENLNAHT